MRMIYGLTVGLMMWTANCSALLRAEDTAPAPKTAPPVMVASGSGEFVRFVEIDVADEASFEITYQYEDKAAPNAKDGEKPKKQGGTFGSFEANTSSVSIPNAGALFRKPGKGPRRFYTLKMLRTDKLEFKIRLVDRLYVVSHGSKLGGVDSIPAPPPIAWPELKFGRLGPITERTQQRVREATVRVSCVSGQGTGTMVETPVKAARLLRRNEVLVMTAAHVVPWHLHALEMQVELFTYNGAKVVGAQKCPARLLYSVGEGREDGDDVAALAVQIPEGRSVTRMKLAPSNYWVCYGQQFAQAGCPGGEDPVIALCKPLQATYERVGGTIMIDRGNFRGASGGGLVDADEFLVGILSGSDGPDDIAPVQTGSGLLRPDSNDRTPKLGPLVTSADSVCDHPGGATAALLKALAAADKARLSVNVKWPVRVGTEVSDDAERQLEVARNQLNAGFDSLPESRQAELRELSEQLFSKYRSALREK